MAELAYSIIYVGRDRNFSKYHSFFSQNENDNSHLQPIVRGRDRNFSKFSEGEEERESEGGARVLVDFSK